MSQKKLTDEEHTTLTVKVLLLKNACKQHNKRLHGLAKVWAQRVHKGLPIAPINKQEEDEVQALCGATEAYVTARKQLEAAEKAEKPAFCFGGPDSSAPIGK